MGETVDQTASDLQWTVRYTWKVVKGPPHPEHTYEKRPSESRAIDCAVFMLDQNNSSAPLHIVCAHIQAPGSDAWQRIE